MISNLTPEILDAFEKLRKVYLLEKFENLEGYKVMTINLVYPFKEGILDEISELYSHYQGIIKNITDWRIAEKKIEIILVVGEFASIKDLYQKLAGVKELICHLHEIVID